METFKAISERASVRGYEARPVGKDLMEAR